MARPVSLLLCIGVYVALILHVLVTPIRSQTVVAEVVGEVRDATGNVLPNVAVTLTNEATGLQTKLTTNDAGLLDRKSVV